MIGGLAPTFFPQQEIGMVKNEKFDAFDLTKMKRQLVTIAIATFIVAIVVGAIWAIGS